MKLTKLRIRQIIKEELEVILTNEEVGDFFGAGVQRKLEAPAEGSDADKIATDGVEDPTDTMATCLERIINPENEDDVFATLSSQTVEELETLYNFIIGGRVQLEADEPKEEEEEERNKRIAKAARAAADTRKRFQQRQASAKRPRSPGDFRSQKDRMDNP